MTTELPARARDPVVDGVRVAAMGVVLVWHTTLSAVAWQDGRLVMPNPLDELPWAWPTTWLLQVMPLFFVVGGWVHARLLDPAGVRVGTAPFLRARAGRLLVPAVLPVALLLAVWAVAGPPWRAAPGLVSPLWFLAVYLGVALLAPLTTALDRRSGDVVPAVATAILVGLDLLRVGPTPALAPLTTAGAWIVCHQLGHCWYRWDREGRSGRRGPVLATAGVVGLALLTGPGPWSPWLVAHASSGPSNLLPTSPVVVAAAALQLGLVLTVAAPLRRFLARPGPATALRRLNRHTVGVYLWQMPVVVALVAGAGALGALPLRSGAAWWWSRPAWLALTVAALAAVLLAGSALHRAVARRAVPGLARAAPAGPAAAAPNTSGAGTRTMHAHDRGQDRRGDPAGAGGPGRHRHRRRGLHRPAGPAHGQAGDGAVLPGPRPRRRR